MDHQSRVSTTRNIAIVIAHGVGEADPGYAAVTLSSTLDKCGGFRVDDEVKVRHLPDLNAPQQDCTFPVFVTSGRLASGERITFAELYWADLTKIGPSRMDAMLGFFRVIFESHHLIDGMLDRGKGIGVRILRHLLLMASWLLRGPIIGFVITTAALLGAALYVPLEIMPQTTPSLWFSGISAVVSLLSLGLLIMAIRRRDATWYDPTAWTALIAATTAATFAGFFIMDLPVVSECPRLPHTPPVCRQNYVNGVYSFLGYLWQIWGAIIILSFLVSIYLAIGWRKNVSQKAPPIFTALGVVLLQFVLWTAIVGTLAMPLIYRADEIKGINALQEGPTPLPEFADAPPTAKKMLQVVPWDPNKPAYGHPSAGKLLKVVPWDPDESDWLDRLAFGYGFNAFMILCILLVGATTQLRRNLLARRSVTDSRISAERMPRLVVGRAILVVLLVVVFWQALYLLLRIPPESVVGRLFGAEGEAFASAWKHLILGIASLATLSLPILASTRLGNFVHIARDLIDHQYSPRRASMLTRTGRARDAEHWPRRARIQARLTALLEELVQKGRFDQVIFVMHSQGSVVAFDYLKDAAPANKEIGNLKPDIVTFGSPLTHLYEHYFFEYAELNKDITALRNSVGRWINIYRIDDYIGREIAHGPDPSVTNEQIGRGGHTDYWKEDRLGRIVLELATRPAGSVDGQPAVVSGT